MTAAAAMNPLNVFAEIFIVSPCLIFFDHPIGIVGLSIKHRPLAAHACARWEGSIPVIARSAATKQSTFAAPWIASLALAMTGKRRSLPLAFPSAAHEIEIAAFVG